MDLFFVVDSFLPLNKLNAFFWSLFSPNKVMEGKTEQKILFAYIAGAMFGVQNCRKGVKTGAIFQPNTILKERHYPKTQWWIFGCKKAFCPNFLSCFLPLFAFTIQRWLKNKHYSRFHKMISSLFPFFTYFFPFVGFLDFSAFFSCVANWIVQTYQKNCVLGRQLRTMIFC